MTLPKLLPYPLLYFKMMKVSCEIENIIETHMLYQLTPARKIVMYVLGLFASTYGYHIPVQQC